MRTFTILLLALIFLCSCNKVNDLNPQIAEVPDQVIQLIEKTYPNPENMTFTELLKGRVWNVELESTAEKYSTTLNPDNIIVAYRLAESSVPDSLQNLLNTGSVSGGAFSNFKEQQYSWFNEGNYGKNYLADYIWKGERFVFRWGVTYLNRKATYNLEMSPVTTEFTTLELKDLPDELQHYIASKSLEFSRATIFINEWSEMQYKIQFQQNNQYFELLFNKDFALVAGSDKLTVLGSISELPPSIQSHLSGSEQYQGFGLSGQFASIYKREYDGVTSYNVNVQKHNGSIQGSQVWFIIFDSSGKPLTRRYLGLY